MQSLCSHLWREKVSCTLPGPLCQGRSMPAGEGEAGPVGRAEPASSVGVDGGTVGPALHDLSVPTFSSGR